MKYILLTSFAALALAACGDTPEAELDEAYTGGGDEAVKMVEGTPAEPVRPTESELADTPPIGEAVQPVVTDPMNELDPSELVSPPVETDAPSEDGAASEIDLDSPEVITGDDLTETIEGALPEAGDLAPGLEDAVEAVDLPDGEEVTETITETVEDVTETVVEETEEIEETVDTEDTEPQQ